jgi:hypothetical protein
MLELYKMPRKELQALCKKHSLPANKTNLAMADALSACLSSSSSVSPLPLALPLHEELLHLGYDRERCFLSSFCLATFCLVFFLFFL